MLDQKVGIREWAPLDEKLKRNDIRCGQAPSLSIIREPAKHRAASISKPCQIFETVQVEAVFIRELGDNGDSSLKRAQRNSVRDGRTNERDIAYDTERQFQCADTEDEGFLDCRTPIQSS